MFTPGEQFSSNKLLFHENVLRRALEEKTVFPIMYEISLSGWCTEKCIYCFNMHNHSRQKLSNVQVEHVLSEIKFLGGKAVEFSGGGEPLLSPIADKAILTAKDLSLSVGIITNGVCLTPYLAEVIAVSASYCRVSIDSIDTDCYQQIRGTRHLVAALTGLQMLVEAKRRLNGKTLIGAHVVWINQSFEDIERTAYYFSQTGIDFLQVRPVDNVPGVNDHLRPLYTEKQLHELIDLTSRFDKGPFRVTTSADKWNEVLQEIPPKNYSGCPGANFTAAIGHDNNLYLCCTEFGNPSYSIGNLNIHSLEELLISDKRKQLIQGINHNECLSQCRNNQLNKLFTNLHMMDVDTREDLFASIRSQQPPLHYEFL
jgi:GTP 3',8-cyclase